MSELISKYDGYNTDEHYTIEDFYNMKIENEETTLSKEEFIKEYEYSDEFECEVYSYLAEAWEDVKHTADIVLDSKDHVSIEGTNRGWRGAREFDTIIKEKTLEAIIKGHINPDRLIVGVYEDRVEISNVHHDGTNSYTLKPFSFEDLTKKELLERVDKEAYEWYGDKLYKATKDDLINYIEENLEWSIEYIARTTETNSSKNSRQMKSAIIGW